MAAVTISLSPLGRGPGRGGEPQARAALRAAPSPFRRYAAPSLSPNGEREK